MIYHIWYVIVGYNIIVQTPDRRLGLGPAKYLGQYILSTSLQHNDIYKTYGNKNWIYFSDCRGDVSTRRVKRWAQSFDELLSDAIGRECFMKFLEKEYSGENLKFWESVQRLRCASCRYVPIRVTEIYRFESWHVK